MLIRHDFWLKIFLKILLNKIFARRERKTSETFIWNINSNILLLKYPSLQRLAGNVCRLHARAGSLLKSTVVDKWNTLAGPNPYAPQVQLVFKSIIPEDICDHKDSKFGWIWNSSNLLLLNSSLLLSQFDNKATTERIHNINSRLSDGKPVCECEGSCGKINSLIRKPWGPLSCQTG